MSKNNGVVVETMKQKYGMVGEVEAETFVNTLCGSISYKVTFGNFEMRIPKDVFEEYFIPVNLPPEDFRKLEARFHELLDIIDHHSEHEPAVIVANRYRELANIIEVIGDMPCEEEPSDA